MKTIPIFFDSQMVADSGSFSPSAAKPAAVVASWQRLGVPYRLMAPTPVTAEQLAQAHDPTFVRDVLSGARSNGFGNRSAEVAASLPWTTGAMYSAARHVREHGGVAAAPCSGFHHARYASPSGFCTFNGLMVTAALLHADGARRIGILDCDQHEGDGTDEIIARLDAQAWVHHFTAGRHYERQGDAAGFFAALPEILRGFDGCDLVLYQAGADPHVDDPLGGWLTTDELRARDERVFASFARTRIPLVWNLAGGYQVDPDGGIRQVIAIHDNTLRACGRAYLGRAMPS